MNTQDTKSSQLHQRRAMPKSSEVMPVLQHHNTIRVTQPSGVNAWSKGSSTIIQLSPVDQMGKKASFMSSEREEGIGPVVKKKSSFSFSDMKDVFRNPASLFKKGDSSSSSSSIDVGKDIPNEVDRETDEVGFSCLPNKLTQLLKRKPKKKDFPAISVLHNSLPHLERIIEQDETPPTASDVDAATEQASISSTRTVIPSDHRPTLLHDTIFALEKRRAAADDTVIRPVIADDLDQALSRVHYHNQRICPSPISIINKHKALLPKAGPQPVIVNLKTEIASTGTFTSPLPINPAVASLTRAHFKCPARACRMRAQSNAPGHHPVPCMTCHEKEGKHFRTCWVCGLQVCTRCQLLLVQKLELEDMLGELVALGVWNGLDGQG